MQKREDTDMKMFKKIMGATLTLLMLLCAFAPVARADADRGYEAYDPDKAIAYAKKHWDDGKGLCATFVSRCVKAGGITFSKATDKIGGRLTKDTKIYSGCWGLYHDLAARKFVTVSKLKSTDGKYLWSKNQGKVAPGDVVFFHATNDKSDGQYRHVVLVSGDTKNGTIKYYAHNEARDGHRNLVTQRGMEMVVVHFKGYQEYNQATYATHGFVKTVKATDLWNYPCSDKTYSKANTVKSLSAGQEVEVVKLICNDRGNYWYEVKYDGKTGSYLYAGDAKWARWDASDITAKDMKLPKGAVTAAKNVKVKGTVSAKYNRLTRIEGLICMVTNSGAKVVAHEAATLKNKASVNIQDTDLKKLDMDRLKACGAYTYTIRVECICYYADGNKLANRTEIHEVIATSFTAK